MAWKASNSINYEHIMAQSNIVNYENMMYQKNDQVLCFFIDDLCFCWNTWGQSLKKDHQRCNTISFILTIINNLFPVLNAGLFV